MKGDSFRSFDRTNKELLRYCHLRRQDITPRFRMRTVKRPIIAFQPMEEFSLPQVVFNTLTISACRHCRRQEF